jgi:hypothetical protein
MKSRLRSKSAYILICTIILLSGFVLILLPGKEVVFISIGTSLIAGGIISFLIFWHQIIQETEQEKFDNIFTAGLDSVYPKRDLDRYDELIKKLSYSIDITGYSLRGFYESFRDIIIEKLNRDSRIKVRILVVDPDSVFSREREKIEGYPEGTFKNSLQTVKSYFSKYPNNIEMRKINFQLPSMIFRIDNVMFIGPYLFQRPSKSTVTFELSRSGWLFEMFEKEFDNLWNNSLNV